MMNTPTKVAFQDLVAEAAELVRGRLDERGVTIRVAGELPLVHADRQRLLEMLQNLIDNAAKFMGDQPCPVIEIGQGARRDGLVTCYVRDNGIGIAPEFHERIFGLFNRLDPKVEGTGIGLALVKRIVEFQGGSIWVESDLNTGSTFYFTLPSLPNSEA
jgi:signal transduction histidine kinase